MDWKLFVGHGFADVRKKEIVSKYHRVVAKEQKSLGAWSAKLKKIYAEDENMVDEDPLERFGTKKKKKKKRIVDVNAGAEQEVVHQKEAALAVVPSDEVLSGGGEANRSSSRPPVTFDKSRLAASHVCVCCSSSLLAEFLARNVRYMPLPSQFCLSNRLSITLVTGTKIVQDIKLKFALSDTMLFEDS